MSQHPSQDNLNKGIDNPLLSPTYYESNPQSKKRGPKYNKIAKDFKPETLSTYLNDLDKFAKSAKEGELNQGLSKTDVAQIHADIIGYYQGKANKVASKLREKAEGDNNPFADPISKIDDEVARKIRTGDIVEICSAGFLISKLLKLIESKDTEDLTNNRQDLEAYVKSSKAWKVAGAVGVVIGVVTAMAGIALATTVLTGMMPTLALAAASAITVKLGVDAIIAGSSMAAAGCLVAGTGMFAYAKAEDKTSRGVRELLAMDNYRDQVPSVKLGGSDEGAV